MSAGMWLVVAIAVAVVAFGLYMTNVFGPRVVRRRVYCPEKNLIANIRIEEKEGSFAALEKPDVVACSLLPGAVDCDKACLHHS
jgi:hypothetical protein